MPDTQPPAGNGLIFVLDIGTRSVVGIAGRQQGGLFHVEASAIQPHQRRAMIDGQIEDIEEVARVAGMVKAAIEQQAGVTFQRVSVAAAGRALKTTRATASVQLPVGVPITAQDIFQLENNAVNTARQKLDAEKPEVPYYCAGYSVVRYQLDGYPFTTILDHRGGLAEVEIIATFLPTEVVSSLRRCMELLELEIDTLTLEPIAAMRAVIPQDLRLLNLALADIGAGTSDIALSQDGTVSGFTMATVAGDEVTEAIIKQYLVSFNEAECIKMAAGTGDAITFTDILGFEQTITQDDLLAAVQPAAQTLAKVIADKILECNGGPPAAVFLVGGGSKTPGLPAILAEILGLGAQRVALAGTDFSGKVLNPEAGLDGPEYATPVGIALVAADNAENEGAAVTINGKRVRLFTQQSCSMTDALLFGGYTYSDLMGRNGRSLTFTLNGARTVLRGEPYSAAQLSLNGLATSLNVPVEDGDAIEIIPATSGADAEARISDYADGAVPIAVTLNGAPLAAGLVALINGALVPADTPIFDSDAVEVYRLRTVAELCAAAGLSTDDVPVTVNGVLAMPGHLLNDGDTVVCPAGTGAAVPPATSPAAPAEKAPEQAPPVTQPAPQVVETAPAEDSVPEPPPAPAPPQAALDISPPTEPLPASPVVAPPATAPADGNMPPQQGAAPTPAPEPSSPTSDTTQTAGAAPEALATPPSSDGQDAKPPATPPAPKPVSLYPPLGKAAGTARAEVPPPTPAPAAFKAPPPPDDLWEKPKAEPAGDSLPPIPRTHSLRIELNGKTVVLPPKPDGAAYQLFDLFTLVDIDPAHPQGPIEVSVNGNPEASYLDEINSGDQVHIGWRAP